MGDNQIITFLIPERSVSASLFDFNTKSQVLAKRYSQKTPVIKTHAKMQLKDKYLAPKSYRKSHAKKKNCFHLTNDVDIYSFL